MDYLRKLVGSAVAGALVSTAVSLNRKRIARLLHARDRQRQIEELRLRYEADLQNIEQIADAESEKYIEKYRDYLVGLVASEGYSGSTADGVLAGLRNSIREVIYLDLEGRATRVYADRLYELDAELAQDQYRYAKLFIIQAKDAHDRMRQAELPEDVPFIGLRPKSDA